MFRFGFDAGEFDHGLRQGFDQLDIPVGVVFAREGGGTDYAVLAELGEAESGGVRV
jgi:hypothetical protein